MKILNLDARDYHMHSSDFSDGGSSVDEIVRFAGEIGLTEIAITDHSDATLEKFKREIDFRPSTMRYIIRNWQNMLNDVKVIFGVEADLLNNSGDVCFTNQNREPDFIILSAHPGVFDSDDATEGFINAIKKYHSKIKCICHPCWSFSETGIEIDVKKLVEVANSYKIPLELNAKNLLRGSTDFEKLDYMLRNANEVYVNSDAHNLYELSEARKIAIKYLEDNNYI